MALKYPDRLESNNPQAYGIVKAIEVAGHKTVNTKQDLLFISDSILSDSKINSNNDAIGQQWYVYSEKCFYQLIDWDNRKVESGWKKILTDTSLNASITSIQSSLDAHKSNTSNPHSVTKVQVGLGNVDNTSDLNKPLSTATQEALNRKLDEENAPEYNVSQRHPNQGAEDSNKYTLQQAISLIPQNLRYAGIKCTFITPENEVETWTWNGGNFSNIEDWSLKEGGALKVEGETLITGGKFISGVDIVSETERKQAEIKREEGFQESITQCTELINTTKLETSKAINQVLSTEQSNKQAEANRVIAEEQRKQNFNTIKTEIGTLKTEITEATNKANEVVNNFQNYITEYNVSLLHPTGGINGTAQYTLDKAIMVIPKEYQRVGIKVTFLDTTNTINTYLYNGIKWDNSNSWSRLDSESILKTQEGESFVAQSFSYLMITNEEKQYLDNLDNISLIVTLQPNQPNFNWYRYVQLLHPFITLHYNGNFRIAGKEILNSEIKSFKNIICINKKELKVKVLNELELYRDINVDSWNDVSFSTNGLVISSGDNNTGFVNWVLFNFDMDIYNKHVSNYAFNLLRNIDSRCAIPKYFIHKDLSIIHNKNPKPYYLYPSEQDENGNWISTFDKAGQGGGLTQGNKVNALLDYFVEVEFEILEGSGKIKSSMDTSHTDRIISIYKNETLHEDFNNLDTGKYKVQGIFHLSIVDRIFPISNNLNATLKIKLLGESWTPIAAIIALGGDKTYDGMLVDRAAGKLRQLKSSYGSVQLESIKFGSTQYNKVAPSRAPFYLGEKWVNVTTGDIYEAPNLTEFKKINNV